MTNTTFPKCLRHLTKLGQAINVSADELERSQEEFNAILCSDCMAVGRAAGYGNKPNLDPRKKVLRHYRDLLDGALTPKDIENWVGSSTLDREITPELFVVLTKIKEARVIELALGIV